MFDIYLRNLKDLFYDLILKPFFKIMVKMKITPNFITMVGFFIGLICAYYCHLANTWFAFLFWTLNRFIDGLDGVYARKTGQSSKFGGFLDITTDFTIYSLIPIFLCFNIKTECVNWHLGLSLSLMLGTFFVNGACLFMLSTILEKHHSEVTTVSMPASLV